MITYADVVAAYRAPGLPSWVGHDRVGAFLWANRAGILNTVHQFHIANVSVDKLVILIPDTFFAYPTMDTMYGLRVRSCCVDDLMVAMDIQLTAVPA